jgi:hypothetical protein
MTTAPKQKQKINRRLEVGSFFVPGQIVPRPSAPTPSV